MLVGNFLFIVRVFLILESILVVLQYGLYIINIHSIWVFIVVMGSKLVQIHVVFFFGQNSIGVFCLFSTQINFFHIDDLFFLFCCFNPCLEIVIRSLLNGLYGNIGI